ncbi:von Willebrand factor type A [Candidatus Protofrankia datiscae]|uniref:von Willebrand factor type A n=2 Tax=Frankiaceae TaxID=74712 RepID=F8AZD3_9ACTN|nr:von Willebrand factor type A [Candidatus Protofrankia datiscae]
MIMPYTTAPLAAPTRRRTAAAALAVTVILALALAVGAGGGTPAAAVVAAAPAAQAPAPGAPQPDPGIPPADPGVAQVDLNAVMTALRLNDVAADYVLLVDTSASMRDGALFDQVRDFLRGYVAGLTPADRFTLIRFDAVPALLYSGSAADAGSAIDQLPLVPNGGATDIGAAIREAVNELDRRDASPVSAVFLLTDGAHNPPRSSDFPDPESNDRPWQALQDHTRQRLDLARVHGHGIALRNDDQAMAGASLLKWALPATKVLALPPDQLRAYLDRAKEDSRRLTAAGLLTPDTQEQVTVSWEPRLADVDPGASHLVTQVKLTSRAKWLPVELTNVSITPSRPDVQAVGVPDRIILPPGQSVTIPVILTWQQHSAGWLRRSQVVTGELRLGATIDSPWRDVANYDFKLPLRLRFADESTVLHGSNPDGWNLWGVLRLLLLVAAVILAAILGRLWWYPRLAGILLVEWPNGQVVQVELSGRKAQISTRHRIDAPGTGSVRGRRARTDGETPRTDILVRYRPRQVSGRLPRVRFSPGQSRIVGNVTFTYPEGTHAEGWQREAGPFARFPRFLRGRRGPRDRTGGSSRTPPPSGKARRAGP